MVSDDGAGAPSYEVTDPDDVFDYTYVASSDHLIATVEENGGLWKTTYRYEAKADVLQGVKNELPGSSTTVSDYDLSFDGLWQSGSEVRTGTAFSGSGELYDYAFDPRSLLAERRTFDDVSTHDLAGDYPANGSFEDYTGTPDDGSNDTFASWSATMGSGSLVDADTGGYKTGSTCVKLISYMSSDHIESVLPAALGGWTVDVVFFTRGDGTNDGRVKVFNQTDLEYIEDDESAGEDTGVTGTDWEEVTRTYTLPAGKSIRLRLFGPGGSQTDYAKFDHVRVRPTTPDASKTFTYDTHGNRDEVAVDGGTPTVYNTNSVNLVASTTSPSETFTYDDDGNRTSDGTWDYTWDTENRLVAATPKSPSVNDLKVESVYDYLGRRIRKTLRKWDGSDWDQIESDEKFLYDGHDMVAILDATDNDSLAKTLTWGIDGLLLATKDHTANPAEINYYLHDAHGNVAQVIDTSGTVLAKYSYDPFGFPYDVLNFTTCSRFLFQNLEYEPETGLYNTPGGGAHDPKTGEPMSGPPGGKGGGGGGGNPSPGPPFLSFGGATGGIAADEEHFVLPSSSPQPGSTDGTPSILAPPSGSLPWETGPQYIPLLRYNPNRPPETLPDGSFPDGRRPDEYLFPYLEGISGAPLTPEEMKKLQELLDYDGKEFILFQKLITQIAQTPLGRRLLRLLIRVGKSPRVLFDRYYPGPGGYHPGGLLPWYKGPTKKPKSGIYVNPDYFQENPHADHLRGHWIVVWYWHYDPNGKLVLKPIAIPTSALLFEELVHFLQHHVDPDHYIPEANREDVPNYNNYTEKEAADLLEEFLYELFDYFRRTEEDWKGEPDIPRKERIEVPKLDSREHPHLRPEFDKIKGNGGDRTHPPGSFSRPRVPAEPWLDIFGVRRHDL